MCNVFGKNKNKKRFFDTSVSLLFCSNIFRQLGDILKLDMFLNTVNVVYHYNTYVINLRNPLCRAEIVNQFASLNSVSYLNV